MAKALPTYPRQVYALTAKYGIRKITLVREAWLGGFTKSGVRYRSEDFADTPAQLAKKVNKAFMQRRKRLNKMLATLDQQESSFNQAVNTLKEKK